MKILNFRHMDLHVFEDFGSSQNFVKINNFASKTVKFCIREGPVIENNDPQSFNQFSDFTGQLTHLQFFGS